MSRGKPKPGICAITGCGMQKMIVGRGLCSKHYQEFRRKGTIDGFDRRKLPPMACPDKKICGTCKLELPIDCFQLNATELNPLRRKSVCRDCTKKQSKKLRDLRKKEGLCLYCEMPAIPNSDRCGFHVQERARWRSTATARVAALMTSTRKRANERGLIFSLDEEWISTRLAGVCELTGLPFDLEPGRKIGRFNPYAPSIDRIIAGGHYTKENCRMIVMALNVGINYWGEEIYRHIAKAYFKQRRSNRKGRNVPLAETYNLLLENPQSIRTRSH